MGSTLKHGNKKVFLICLFFKLILLMFHAPYAIYMIGSLYRVYN